MADSGYEAGDGRVISATPKALLIDIDGVGREWVPRSQIHDDSEVYDADHNGKLVVSNWYADKQGWL